VNLVTGVPQPVSHGLRKAQAIESTLHTANSLGLAREMRGLLDRAPPAATVTSSAGFIRRKKLSKGDYEQEAASFGGWLLSLQRVPFVSALIRQIRHNCSECPQALAQLRRGTEDVGVVGNCVHGSFMPEPRRHDAGWNLPLSGVTQSHEIDAV
jgi:hypothetical protein